jgi:predicted MPP superfamily phosphohydrolase
LGNHDAAEIALRLEEMGMRMLVNEAEQVQRGQSTIWIAGVDDPFDYGCHDLDAALESVPEDGFKVLLAHAPELYQEASQKGVHLYLSGHTHAGQIRFPLIGSVRNNANCPREYAHGHWGHNGMHGYTSAGVGCSCLPIRFNCPPELILIELRTR